MAAPMSDAAESPPLPYEEIASAIQVRHLTTEIDGAQRFPIETSQAEAFDVLARLNFDYAPVVSSSQVVGRVARSRLSPRSSDPVAAVMEPLRAGALISANATIRALMRALQIDRFLLVLEGTEINGLVTPWDLNKEASRAYLFMLLADLEIGLSNAIRAQFPIASDSAELLPERRRRLATDTFDRLDPEERTDLVSCMYFTDILSISARVPQIRARYGDLDEAAFNELAGRLSRLRNTVDHPVRTLLTDSGGLGALITLEDQLRLLVTAGRSRY
jgi:hypothetical protein